MAQNINRIADKLRAKRIARVAETGGGAFGAARLARIVNELRSKLAPGQGRRPGRPTRAEWVHHPKVPMSATTKRRLQALAREASTSERKVTAMQVAAQILEQAMVAGE